MSATAPARTLPAIHADPATRAQIIAGMRERLDWLEANPHIPLRAWGDDLVVGVDGQQVEHLAAQMGVTATHSTSSHRAVRQFGPVAYVAHAPNLEVAR